MKKSYIKARSDSRVYEVESGSLDLKIGDKVLFESDQCQEVATVVDAKSFADDQDSVTLDNAKAEIIRRLNDRDLEIDHDRGREARSNLSRCRDIVEKHGLPMELLDADISYDGKKLTFYFSAPGRVDFRSLVSELASTFQKLIRLQQVGARDRARCVGGMGRCGEEFCCKRFLKGSLDGISIDMAYEQNLAQMGSNRVTGACGKLMCCLKYELESYKEIKAKMPAIGSEIKTANGRGTVISQCVVKNTVKVELSDKSIVEVSCTN